MALLWISSLIILYIASFMLGRKSVSSKQGEIDSLKDEHNKKELGSFKKYSILLEKLKLAEKEIEKYKRDYCFDDRPICNNCKNRIDPVNGIATRCNHCSHALGFKHT